MNLKEVNLNLEFSYGSGFRLDIPDLRIKQGETLFLQGPSGCGKTTVLNLLAGVTGDASKGDLQQVFKRRSYVMHESSLLPWRDVEGMLALEERFRDVACDPGTFYKLCGEFGLPPDIGKRRGNELSLGMRQRVEIAKALAFSPDLLLLDEALSGIDPKSKHSVIRKLVATVEAGGMSIVATTHQVVDILRLASRVCIMENGTVVDEVPFTAAPADRMRKSSQDLIGDPEAKKVIQRF